MLSIRVIPHLDIKGPNLVKGINFEGLRVLGRPESFAQHYYENGADELFYMDTVASLYERNSLIEIIERTTDNIFIPITVGGGLRDINDIRMVLRHGADKASINTAAVKRPELIREAAYIFGSATIVVSIDIIGDEVYIDYGRQTTGINAFDWALEVAKLGAGELVVTSISNEGMGKGYDLDITKKIAESVSIPVVANGGAGNLTHILDAITKGKADSVSLASMLHYNYIKSCNDVNEYDEEGNTEFLTKGMEFRLVNNASINEVKSYLTNNGINCRLGN